MIFFSINVKLAGFIILIFSSFDLLIPQSLLELPPGSGFIWPFLFLYLSIFI